jgi:pimeloyl-ACP methyl ester carboxylesterase
VGVPPRPYLPLTVRGSGPPAVLCPGFGLAPPAYARLEDLLAGRVRLAIPALLGTGGPWSYDRVLAALAEDLAAAGLERPVLMGHSFGGGIALGYASRWPEEVARLVLVDSIGLSGRWALAREALVGTRVQHLVTWPAVRDFGRSLRHSPVSLARAGWWAYSVDKEDEVVSIAAAGIPIDVVWAADDSVLGPDWGHRFARRIGARFTVVDDADGPVEHGWVYRRPDLFVRTMERIGVLA